MGKKALFVIAPIIIALVVVMSFVLFSKEPKVQSEVASHPEIDMEIEIKSAQPQPGKSYLTKDTVVSGEIELEVGLPSEEYAYIEYKINGFFYEPAYGPAYGTRIDTSQLPDGWNQLLLIGYKEANKVEGVKQVIFKVDNKHEKKARSPRKGEIYPVENKPAYKEDYIPVLMYHDFKEEITKDQESAVVHPDLFKKQLDALLDHGYTAISFQDLHLYMTGKGGLPAKPVIITADDGYLSNYEVAFPILQEYNMPATFFVTTRYVGVDTTSAHFTWEEAKEMEASGLIDIQSHTHTHALLSTLPDDEVSHQVSVSIGLIEQNLGERDVKVLAYPQFYCNENTKRILKQEGVQLQITNLGSNTQPTNVQRIHVANTTSPEDLIKEIEELTQ